MAWLDDAQTEHLLCRDTGIRHRWEPLTAQRETKGFSETIKCGRCGAEKTRYLTKTGLIRKTKIVYPEGYVRTGEGRVTKAENAAIRLTALRRRYDLED